MRHEMTSPDIGYREGRWRGVGGGGGREGGQDYKLNGTVSGDFDIFKRPEYQARDYPRARYNIHSAALINDVLLFN